MPSRKSLNQVRERLWVKHYSLRTVNAHPRWIRRFIIFHGNEHPREMRGRKVETFLSLLATAGRVRAKHPARVPVVLTESEVSAGCGATTWTKTRCNARCGPRRAEPF